MFLPPFRAKAPESQTASSLQATANTAQRMLDQSLSPQISDIDISNAINFTPQDRVNTSHLTPNGSSIQQPDVTNTLSVHGLQPSINGDVSSKQKQTSSLQVPAFSASTQEILRRISAAHNVSPSSPEWEAARQQVLKSMAAVPVEGSLRADANLVAPARRGRGRGRPPNSLRFGTGAVMNHGDKKSHESPTRAVVPPVESSIRGRARGGRPRGSGRGILVKGKRRKRARDDSDQDNDDGKSDSDVSSNPSTPKAPTVTKSGRSITKPSTFIPITDRPPSQRTNPHTPSGASARGGASRGRSGRRSARPPELALCAKCSRGHSPESNVMVFCDGCNTPWHQWCHDPHINREVIEIAEKEWFCSSCKHKHEEEIVPIDKRSSGEEWSIEERRTYIEGLSSPTLRALLLRALLFRPDLPIFPPRDPVTSRYGLEKKDATATSSVLTPLDGSSPTPIGSATNLSPQSQQPEKYPDIAIAATTNDPPSTYPRPGHGPVRPKATTDPDDVHWLIDDENGFSVFSHFYHESIEALSSSCEQSTEETNTLDVQMASDHDRAPVSLNKVMEGLVNVAAVGEQGIKGSWIRKAQ